MVYTYVCGERGRAATIPRRRIRARYAPHAMSMEPWTLMECSGESCWLSFLYMLAVSRWKMTSIEDRRNWTVSRLAYQWQNEKKKVVLSSAYLTSIVKTNTETKYYTKKEKYRVSRSHTLHRRSDRALCTHHTVIYTASCVKIIYDHHHG